MQATAQVVAACGGCGTRYRVAGQHTGKKLKCRKCDQLIAVPADGPAPRPAAKQPSLRQPPARSSMTAAPAAKTPSTRLTAPKSRHSAGSIRERADQKRGESHIGPMAYVLVGAVVVVIVLYLALAG